MAKTNINDFKKELIHWENVLKQIKLGNYAYKEYSLKRVEQIIDEYKVKILVTNTIED